MKYSDLLSEMTIQLDELKTRSFGRDNSKLSAFGQALAIKHNLDTHEIDTAHRRAVFDLTYNDNSPFKHEKVAKAFLNSEHGAKLADSYKNVVKHPEFKELTRKFGYSAPQYITEESEISEAAAPGMEDWIKSNKKEFIDRYGKEKGLKILYATAWKIHDKQLDEMVMDAIHHPKLGKIEWRNEGGAHIISTLNKETGSKNVHAIGSHKQIAQKWAAVKDRLLKEDTDWSEQ